MLCFDGQVQCSKLFVSRRVVDVLIEHTRLIEYDILRHACTAVRIVVMKEVSERLDIKTIGSILLRIESSISSMGNRLAAVKRSQLDDTIQFQIPQRFGEATPIPASGLQSVMFSPSPAVSTTAVAISAQPLPLSAPSPTTVESRRVPVAKYLKLAQSSLDIANKFIISIGDKTFENVNQLEKAFGEYR